MSGEGRLSSTRRCDFCRRRPEEIRACAETLLNGRRAVMCNWCAAAAVREIAARKAGEEKEAER